MADASPVQPPRRNRRPSLEPIQEGEVSSGAPAANMRTSMQLPHEVFDAPAPLTIHDAVHQGDVQAVRACLAAGQKINQRDSMLQYTPLHVAADQGNEELVRFLIFASASVNAPAKYDLTPLHVAATSGHTIVVKCLLDNHADPLSMDSLYLATPSFLAVTAGHNDTLRVLLSKKKNGKPAIDVNDTAKDKFTMLHVAAKRGHAQICETLLEFGARPDMKNNQGRTPLVVAMLSETSNEETRLCLQRAARKLAEETKAKAAAEQEKQEQTTKGVEVNNSSENKININDNNSNSSSDSNKTENISDENRPPSNNSNKLNSNQTGLLAPFTGSVQPQPPPSPLLKKTTSPSFSSSPGAPPAAPPPRSQKNIESKQENNTPIAPSNRSFSLSEEAAFWESKAKSLNYLEERKIIPLLSKLVKRVSLERPEDPFPFLIDLLKQERNAKLQSQ